VTTLPKVEDAENLTTAEVGKVLRRNEATLRRWRRQGRGPRFIKPPPGSGPGSKILYPRAEFEAWLAEQTRPTA